MAGRFANTQILNPNVTPIPQIMADPRLQNNRSDVFVFRDADLPSDYFDANPFSPINKEYPVRNVAPLSDEVVGNIRDAVFGNKQEDAPAKDILIQAAKNDIARNRKANEEIKSLNPRDGRKLRQGRVPEEKSMVFDAGDSLKHYFDTDPFNPNPVRNVAPFSDETNRTIKDSVFGKDEDDGFNDRVISAYQEKMLGPSEKVSNKELIDAVKRDDGKRAIISEAKGSPKTIDVEPKKEDFKARAKKSIMDWTDNSGMQYIAQVNPYAAAGMGFANQMANPFKQKYFEDRADANEEEDARRLNYEIGRQAKLDALKEKHEQERIDLTNAMLQPVSDRATVGLSEKAKAAASDFNKKVAAIAADKTISPAIKMQMYKQLKDGLNEEIGLDTQTGINEKANEFIRSQGKKMEGSSGFARFVDNTVGTGLNALRKINPFMSAKEYRMETQRQETNRNVDTLVRNLEASGLEAKYIEPNQLGAFKQTMSPSEQMIIDKLTSQGGGAIFSVDNRTGNVKMYPLNADGIPLQKSGISLREKAAPLFGMVAEDIPLMLPMSGDFALDE